MSTLAKQIGADQAQRLEKAQRKTQQETELLLVGIRQKVIGAFQAESPETQEVAIIFLERKATKADFARIKGFLEAEGLGIDWPHPPCNARIFISPEVKERILQEEREAVSRRARAEEAADKAANRVWVDDDCGFGHYKDLTTRKHFSLDEDGNRMYL